MQFETTVTVEKLNIQFQGGFAGKDSHLELASVDSGEKFSFDIYPEDVNQMQVSFSLKTFSLVRYHNFGIP